MQGKMANFLSTFDSEAHFQPKQLQTTFQRIVSVLGNPIPDSILEFPENCRTGPPVPCPTPRFDPEATGTLSSAVASLSGATLFSLFGPDSKKSPRPTADDPQTAIMDKGSSAQAGTPPAQAFLTSPEPLEPEQAFSSHYFLAHKSSMSMTNCVTNLTRPAGQGETQVPPTGLLFAIAGHPGQAGPFGDFDVQGGNLGARPHSLNSLMSSGVPSGTAGTAHQVCYRYRFNSRAGTKEYGLGTQEMAMSHMPLEYDQTREFVTNTQEVLDFNEAGSRFADRDLGWVDGGSSSPHFFSHAPPKHSRSLDRRLPKDMFKQMDPKGRAAKRHQSRARSPPFV